jgi:hypothetical protein
MDFSAPAGSGIEFKFAAGQRRALFHAQQTKAGPAHDLFPDSSDAKAYAVIPNAQVEFPLLYAHLHGHVSRLGMSQHVGECFLRDAKTFGFNQRIRAAFQQVRLNLEMEAGERRLAFRVPP